MPSAPLRYCAEQGCPAKVKGGRCPQHQQRKRQHERRFSATTPGVNYGRRWGKLRAAYLARHPFCVECQPHSLALATQLDHIVPHRGDAALFWDEANLQGLCDAHHAAKTAREVGLGSTR